MSTLDPATRLDRDELPPLPRKRRATFSDTEWTWNAIARIWRHPFRTGWLGDAFNRYGVPVSVARCTVCGRTTMTCPAYTPEQRIPANVGLCLDDVCASYDPNRDVSFMLAQTDEAPLPQVTRWQRFVLRIKEEHL